VALVIMRGKWSAAQCSDHTASAAGCALSGGFSMVVNLQHQHLV